MRARNILEGRAHEVVERVAKRALIGEDDLIEFKREWIEPHKAARRIAAHANAARGHEMLWLIGVDPNAVDPLFGLPSDTKPEQWFDQVKAFFVDGNYPGFQCFQVPYRDKTVYAIVFDTSSFPFLKRYNQRENKPKGVAESELPWREGTAIRSVRQIELLTLLYKLPPLPTFEVLEAQCTFSELKIGEDPSCELYLKMCVMPPTGSLTINDEPNPTIGTDRRRRINRQAA